MEQHELLADSFHFGSVNLRSGTWYAGRVVIRDCPPFVSKDRKSAVVYNQVWLWNDAGERLDLRGLPDGELRDEDLEELVMNHAASRSFPDADGGMWTAYAAGKTKRLILADQKGLHRVAEVSEGKVLPLLTLDELRAAAQRSE